jgi:hypothetical protein
MWGVKGMESLVPVRNLGAAVWTFLTAIPANSWTAMATWLLVAVTLHVVRVQVREQRRSNAALLDKQHETNAVTALIRLAETWDADPMRRNREHLKHWLLEGTAGARLKVRDFMGPVAGFFERVGLLMRRGIVDREMVWSEFSCFVLNYYAALADSIQRERQGEEDPTLYTEFEGLYRQMLPLTTERRGQDATPTDQSVRDFIENEPNN